MKDIIINSLSKILKLNKQEISNLIEIPKDSTLGDLAFPCFTLAKSLKKNPVEIAKGLASKINSKQSSDYEKFGSAAKLKKDPIKHLLEVYVKAQGEEYEEEAREWFKKMESGDKESL